MSVMAHDRDMTRCLVQRRAALPCAQCIVSSPAHRPNCAQCLRPSPRPAWNADFSTRGKCCVRGTPGTSARSPAIRARTPVSSDAAGVGRGVRVCGAAAGVTLSTADTCYFSCWPHLAHLLAESALLKKFQSVKICLYRYNYNDLIGIFILL